MWRRAETVQQAETQSQVVYSLTFKRYRRPLVFRRLVPYYDSYRPSRSTVAAPEDGLARFSARLARTVSLRFRRPPRLSSPVRYRTCVVMYTACLCWGVFVRIGAASRGYLLPSRIRFPYLIFQWNKCARILTVGRHLARVARILPLTCDVLPIRAVQVWHPGVLDAKVG